MTGLTRDRAVIDEVGEETPGGFWRSVARGTAWSYFATYGGKSVIFISTVVLARLLLKEDFGVAGYAIVVISFLNILHDMGIGTALIYFDLDDRRTATAFWLNVISGLALFGVTWLLGPLAGEYFNDDRAVDVTRVLGLTFPLAALGNIHDSLLRKAISFDRKFKPDMLKAVTKAAVAIGLAIAGFGYWSILLGHLAGVAVWVACLWFLVPWRPTLEWSWAEAKSIIRYGSAIACVNFFAIVLLNVDYLLVGRYLGVVALGVYTIAFRLPELVVQEFPNLVSNVLLPAFARFKDDDGELRSNIVMTLRYSAMVTVPTGLGLALVAKPLTLFLLSDKWADAAPIMTAIAIQMTILSLSFNLGAVYKAQGRSQVLIGVIAIRLVVVLPALWWAVQGPGTLAAVAWVHVLAALVIVAIDMMVATRILDISGRALYGAISPAIVGGTAMVAVGLAVGALIRPAAPFVELMAVAAAGAVTYVGTMYWYERDAFALANSRIRATLARV